MSKSCESPRSRKKYEEAIRQFQTYVKEHYHVNIENLKQLYREAKYKGEVEREKFLDQFKDIIDSFSCYIKTLDYSPMNEARVLATIRSYCHKSCGMKDLEVESPKHVYPKYHNRDITKEEIRKILEHASIRDKLFFLMMCESGLRPDTLVNLRYRHIKEDYEAKRTPMKIDLPSNILKDRVSARFTFIGEDSVKLLREYLSLRPSMKDDDPIFLAERGEEKIGMEALSNKFGRIILKLGLCSTSEGKGKPKELRLYSLRKYFSNNMRCDSTFREYWMCHSNVTDHYISRDVARHREEYTKGYPSLRIFDTSFVDLGDLTAQLRNKDSEIKELKEQLLEFKATQEKLEEAIMNPNSESFGALTRRIEAYIDDKLKGWEKNIPGTEPKEKKRSK